MSNPYRGKRAIERGGRRTVLVFCGLLLLVLAAAALDRPGQAHSFFQLSGAAPRSLRETAELMLQVNGLDFQANWGGRPDPDRVLERPQRLSPPPPGWSPRVPLEDGRRRFWAGTP